MKKKTVRAGIVGGPVSPPRFISEAIQKVYGTNVEIKGVHALQGAEAYGQKRGIAVYDSLERLIDDVDVIHCCTTASRTSRSPSRPWSGQIRHRGKPLTGFFGDGDENFNGQDFPKEIVHAKALASIERMLQAEKKSKGRILYAENWVYAPSIQKEREILEKPERPDSLDAWRGGRRTRVRTPKHMRTGNTPAVAS